MINKSPIIKLTKIVWEHKAFLKENFSTLALIYTKFLLQEPFRWYENLRYNPTVVEQTKLKKDPIFILGHWRSGTSFLQYLLGQDPQFGYLTKFQAIFPEVFLGAEKFLKPIFHRLSNQAILKKKIDAISINIDWDSPSEIDIAMILMLSNVSAHLGHLFPKQSDKYFNKFFFFENISSAEKKEWQSTYRYLVNKVSIREEGKQLLIKSPGNTGRIKQLLELYPNAKFVYIHRNPFNVYHSNIKIWNMVLNNLSFQKISPTEVSIKVIKLYQQLLKKYLAQKQFIPKGNLVEIQYEAFHTNPISCLQNVYDQLSLTGFEDALPRFKIFLDNMPAYHQKPYNNDSDSNKLIQHDWAFSLKEWPYSIPSLTEVKP